MEVPLGNSFDNKEFFRSNKYLLICFNHKFPNAELVCLKGWRSQESDGTGQAAFQLQPPPTDTALRAAWEHRCWSLG